MRTCFKMLEIDPEKGIDRPIRHPHIAEKYSKAIFALGAGDKGNDPARIRGFANYFTNNPEKTYLNIKTAFHDPAKAFEVDGAPASASRMRKAFNEEDWETFKKLLPHESLYNDVVQVLTMEGALQENFFDLTSLFSLVEEAINEVSSEKQRKWACAQVDNNFKGKRQLSKKQAEEMCKSEVKEVDLQAEI